MPKTLTRKNADIPNPKEVKMKQYINSHLRNAANIAFSNNGLVYFTELERGEVIKKMRLNVFSCRIVFGFVIKRYTCLTELISHLFNNNHATFTH